TTATSSRSEPGAEPAKGTTATGTGSVTPRVMSICSCARAAIEVRSSAAPSASMRSFSIAVPLAPSILRCKVKDELTFEQGRIRRLRQRRGAIDCCFDRLAHGIIAIAAADAHRRDGAALRLGHAHFTHQADTRRRRTRPGALDAGADLVDIGTRLRTVACRRPLLLGIELRRQFCLAARQLGLLAFPPFALGPLARLPLTLDPFAFRAFALRPLLLGAFTLAALPFGTLLRLALHALLLGQPLLGGEAFGFGLALFLRQPLGFSRQHCRVLRRWRWLLEKRFRFRL